MTTSSSCALAERLCAEANAQLVLVIARAGQIAAAAGQASFDTTSLASLFAGAAAASGAIARLLDEPEIETLSHEGKRVRVHLEIAGRFLVAVIFDARTNLGLVRLRVRQVRGEIERLGRAEGRARDIAISDADIDELFGPRET